MAGKRSDNKNEDRSIFDRPLPEPDAVVRFGDDPDQVFEVFGNGTPVALVHGGYWSPEYDRAHLRPLARAIADEGYQCALVEYRRVPGAPEVYVEDVAAACAAAHAEVVVGHSAGGHLALLAAPATPVLALAPIADLEHAIDVRADDDAALRFLGDREAAAFDPKLTRRSSPSVLIHGNADTLVDVVESRTFTERHPGAKLVELNGIGHFELIDPQHAVFALLTTEIDGLIPAQGDEES